MKKFTVIFPPTGIENLRILDDFEKYFKEVAIQSLNGTDWFTFSEKPGWLFKNLRFQATKRTESNKQITQVMTFEYEEADTVEIMGVE